ncbi:MAG: zinc ABC transporter substrate-binding protein [Sulfolobales archaeon]|nr:zinc ABC transporter substrate-binding protein [Sulfolobales archaeon]MDW8083545.1 zinc ABC transporter substrate-binding protein [Sulfolobales archaeon]
MEALKKGVLLVFLLIVVMPLYSVDAESSEVVVAVTHPALKSLATAIGGNRVRVIMLIPQGVDVHHYEPPALELLALLREVDIVVMTGPSHLPIEMKIEELHRSKLYNWILVHYPDYVSEGFKLLINPATGKENPHEYVLSMSGLRIIARSLYRALISVDPEGVEHYELRLASFLENLERIEKAVESSVKLSSVAKVGLLTPLLQYAVVDTGLTVSYIVIAEHDIPLEIRDIVKAASDYGKLYDVLVISDEELVKHQQVVEELVRRGVRVVVVPLSTLVREAPELVPLAIALSLSTPHISVELAGGQDVSLYYLTAISAVLAAVITILYVFKLKSHGRTAR